MTATPYPQAFDIAGPDDPTPELSAAISAARELPASAGSASSDRVAVLPVSTEQSSVYFPGGATTTILNTTAVTGHPFTTTENGTLVAVNVRVNGAVPTATLAIGITECDSDGKPTGTLTVLTAALDCATTGVKSVVVSHPIVAGTVYSLVTLGGSTEPSMSGAATVTSGMPLTASIGPHVANAQGTVSDNVPRGLQWRFTPAVNGVLDTSPTWNLSGSFLTLVTYSLEIE